MILRNHDIPNPRAFRRTQNRAEIAGIGYPIDKDQRIRLGLEHVFELGIGILANDRGDPLMARIASAIARHFGFFGEGNLSACDAHAIHLFLEALAVSRADVERPNAAGRRRDELAHRLHTEHQVGAGRLVPFMMMGSLSVAIGVATGRRTAPVVTPLGGAVVVAKPCASSVTAIFHCRKC